MYAGLCWGAKARVKSCIANFIFSFLFFPLTHKISFSCICLIKLLNTLNVNMYEAQADTINVDDISRNSNNRIVLRRLQRNDVDDEIPTLRIDDEPDDDEDEEDCIYYFPEGTNDVMITSQRGPMIWDGWDTLLVNMSI